MRTLLALAVFVGSLSAWTPDVSAARKAMRGAYGYYPAAPLRSFPRGNGVCEERARFHDPTGLYRGYPCWARGAFGPRR